MTRQEAVEWLRNHVAIHDPEIERYVPIDVLIPLMSRDVTIDDALLCPELLELVDAANRLIVHVPVNTNAVKLNRFFTALKPFIDKLKNKA